MLGVTGPQSGRCSSPSEWLLSLLVPRHFGVGGGLLQETQRFPGLDGQGLLSAKMGVYPDSEMSAGSFIVSLQYKEPFTIIRSVVSYSLQPHGL